MQRHQFCVATLSRNRAPGLIRRVLSGLFEDGSILATLACGAGSQSLPGSAPKRVPLRAAEAAHSRTAMPPKRKKSSGAAAPPKKKKPAAKKPAANKTPQKRPPEEQGPTPLYLACQKGHVDAARSLLAEGAEVDRADKYGWTPLRIACYEGQIDAVRLLLDNGAGVDGADKEDDTPLIIACSKGHVDAVRLLLENGADVNRAGPHGATPLYIACGEGHVDLAQLLLDKARRSIGRTSTARRRCTSPAMMATSTRCGCCWKTARTLIGQGETV